MQTRKEAKVIAQRLSQDGVTMYVASLEAGLINELGVVDTWKPYLEDLDPDQGYQRAVVTAHAKRIAKYLLDEEEERLMPTAILLSSRKPLKFEPLGLGHVGEGGHEVGVLTLEAPLYKVDGQHRTEGFALAAEVDSGLSRFPLPTVIMESREKMEEIGQFFTVNTTAKRVRTDLADRLLRAMGAFDETPSKGWRKKALEIVDYLVKEPGGAWEGEIKMPNSLTGIASQRTWTESLKPVLDGVIGDQSSVTVAKALSNYWGALRKLMPEAFKEPKDYVIQKSTGVFSLNELAAHVFKIAYQEGNDFSVDHLAEILERAEDSGKLDEQFWASTKNGGEAPQYAGRGGMATLTKEILDAMPEGQVKINV
jgi:DGQHR domain-containing protein